MRQIVINHKDYVLFGDELCTDSYVFFNKHKSAFERMMEDQGQLFWRRYLVSFKAHCIDNSLIAHPKQKGTSYRYVVLDGFNYLDMQILNYTKPATRTKAFIEDMAIIGNYQHLLNTIDTKKRAQDPFCKAECREVYRKVFAEEGVGPFARVKAWVFCPIYLRLAASLSVLLRKWMEASETEDQHSYWVSPPCDMFLRYEFSDEAFKLLASEVDPDIRSVSRQKISRLEMEKYGEDFIDQYLPCLQLESKNELLSNAERRRGYRIQTLEKPGCYSLDFVARPLNKSQSISSQEYGIARINVVRHQHRVPANSYMRWKPKDENDEHVEEDVRTVIDLLTNEERKRFYCGIVAEKERRQQTDNPPPESPLAEYIKEYSPAISAIKKAQPMKLKKPYVYKRCSMCHKIEDEKRTFKFCKICHDRNADHCRSYCGRKCQVDDWDRHRNEHKEIERIQRVIEDDFPEDWALEFDRFTVGHFRVREADPMVEAMKKQMERQIIEEETKAKLEALECLSD
ncbi:uncharacterized protein LOC119737542 [Patiria miniata]|uniref:DUF8117 domain-containing protein n=1 Tax=Patiria miniata TaxID=46514 RepID=A0A914AVX2_PATMI|nr:uncharacterized protein LOC119737542 [Patiria miniata]XP_038067907.1 uncharacterized protein LOC119737542 [Patiria miniata]